MGANVEVQGRCAASSRSVPCNVVRDCKRISWSFFVRANAIVPIAMEVVSFDVDGTKFLIGHNHALGVVGIVEFSANTQPRTRFGAGDEVDNDLMTDQWTSAPVHRDEREQAMF